MDWEKVGVFIGCLGGLNPLCATGCASDNSAEKNGPTYPPNVLQQTSTYASQTDNFASGKTTSQRPAWIDIRALSQTVGSSVCHYGMHDWDLIQSATRKAINKRCPNMNLRVAVPSEDFFSGKEQKIDLRYDGFVVEQGGMCISPLSGSYGFRGHILISNAEIDRYCISQQPTPPPTSTPSRPWKTIIAKSIQKEIKASCQREKPSYEVQGCIEAVGSRLIASAEKVCSGLAVKDGLTTDNCLKILLKSPWLDTSELQRKSGGKMPNVIAGIESSTPLVASDGSNHRSILTFVDREAANFR